MCSQICILTFHTVVHWTIKSIGIQLTLTPETFSMMSVHRNVAVTLLTYTYTYVRMYVINIQSITYVLRMCAFLLYYLYTQLHTSYRYVFFNCVVEHSTQVCIYICLYIRMTNAIKIYSSYMYISQCWFYTNYEQYYM